MAEFSEQQHPPHPPDPGVPPPGEGQAADLYRRGVLAFKQGRDREALDQFHRLAQLPSTTLQWQIKGQMGQILAQQRLGQVDQARQGCEQIIAGGVPQACRWAEAVLAKLPTPAAAQTEAPTQGPPAPPTETSKDQAPPTLASDPKEIDPKGVDPTGFVPLDPPSQVTAAPTTPPPDSGNGKPVAPSAHATPSLRPDHDGTSLFHYQQLNQEAEPEPSDPPLSQAISTPQGMAAAITPPPPTVSSPTTSSPTKHPPTQGQPGTLRPSQRSRAGKPAGKPAGLHQPSLDSPYGRWIVQIVTLLVVLWATTTGIHLLFGGINTLLRRVTWPLRLGGLALLDRSYTAPIVVLLVGLMLTSPWWMDYLLAQIYGQRPLTPRQLQGTHPAVLKQLRQQCQQRGWYLPELRLLPTADPLCFSYGWRPRHLRIVVSQGFLDSGDDERLSMAYAYELAHMVNQATAVISGLGGILLILHTLYGRLALGREGVSSRFLRVALGGMACLCYGLFWGLRRGLLWLSRMRSGWADRRVEAMTQRPDLQQQYLTWLTVHLPAHLIQRGSLHPLWDGLDVLMPLSPHAALSPGSFIPTLGEAATVLNDWANPYRQWLVGGASHLPLGRRFQGLVQRAIQRQQPTLNLVEALPSVPLTVSLPRLMRQKAPVLGLVLGGGLAFSLWFVGGLVRRLDWYRLSWWYQDESLLYGGVLLGLGLGLLTRINTLYPDIPSIQRPISEASQLLGAPDQLPVEGEPCWMAGQLISPLSETQGQNFQGQNLYLATLGGLVKLGFSSPQPILWAIGQNPSPLQPWIGRSVTVSGWRRRNDGVLWVDVSTIGLSSQRQRVPIVTPIWATIISLGCCLAGVFVIWAGL